MKAFWSVGVAAAVFLAISVNVVLSSPVSPPNVEYAMDGPDATAVVFEEGNSEVKGDMESGTESSTGVPIDTEASGIEDATTMPPVVPLEDDSSSNLVLTEDESQDSKVEIMSTTPSSIDMS